MHVRLTSDRDELAPLLQAVQEHAARVCGQMVEREVLPAPAGLEVPAHGDDQRGPRQHPNVDLGTGLRAALDEFVARLEPSFSASTGPRYLGFVTGGVTPAALAGDWLTSTWDQNAFSSLDGAGQLVEAEALAALRMLLELPERHHGTFVSGATMSNTVGLAIAREWLGEQRGVSPAQHGAGALGTVHVLSGSAHSSVSKALSMLGLGRDALVRVPVLAGREAVDVPALERFLEDRRGDGGCIVVANAGTVNTGDFDDLRAIADLRDRHDFWLHVDAAFGAFAAASPHLRHLVDGLDLADSICVDLHKWLNVPYDSAVQFTRRRDLQASVFQNAAAYLGPLGDTPDLAHLTPENSRRLRALPAWFTIRAYGKDGYREIVERCVDSARSLGDAVEAIPGLELLAPVRLNVVCFTLSEEPTGARLADLASRLAGEAFLTPTVLDGVPALRAAFSNWQTTAADVDRLVAALRRELAG